MYFYIKIIFYKTTTNKNNRNKHDYYNNNNINYYFKKIFLCSSWPKSKFRPKSLFPTETTFSDRSGFFDHPGFSDPDHPPYIFFFQNHQLHSLTYHLVTNLLLLSLSLLMQSPFLLPLHTSLFVESLTNL